MLTNEHRAHIVIEFFDKANAHNLIEYKPFSKFSKKTKNILQNANNSGHVYFSFQKIFDQPELLQKFYDQNLTQFGIMRQHSHDLIKNYFLFHALYYIEANKLFFVEILKHGIKIGNQNFMTGPKMELGRLVTSLSQELQYEDFKKLFPIDFRNILGHSSWWWIGDLIVYENKGKEQTMTLGQFEQTMKEFSDTMDALINEYQMRSTQRK